MERAATLLTVDVESDWGTPARAGLDHVLPRLLTLLGRHEARATFFVVGELAPGLARTLAPDGPHEVGSHGHTHARFSRLSPAGRESELRSSRRALQAEGYRVEGFRAPFLDAPAGLHELLARTGYRYDASRGSLGPSLRNRPVRTAHAAHAAHATESTHDAKGAHGEPAPRDGAALPSVASGALRGGLLPCNLTWLRLLHPVGRALLRRDARQFSCHLHEFLDGGGTGGGGWTHWPLPLRALHARGCGDRSWRLLEALLADERRRFVTCRELLFGDELP